MREYKHQITLITDGSCQLPNNGTTPGGWSAILRCGERYKELSGRTDRTTNNRMELTGVLQGLRSILFPSKVTVRTDSRYVITVCESTGWKYRDGKKKKAPKNYDLIEQIMELMERHKVAFEWVKGHAGDGDNERCDYLANTAWIKP